MQRLVFEVRKEVDRGSFRGASDRHSKLSLLVTMAKEMTNRPNDPDLPGCNFRGLALHNIETRHFEAWAKNMQGRGISDRTIANRLAPARWLMTKLGKGDLVPSNAELGLTGRTVEERVPEESRAKELPDEHRLSERVEVNLRLSRELGLRPEEGALVQPHGLTPAVDGEREPVIEVRPEEGTVVVRLHNGWENSGKDKACSWCKGGRAREYELPLTPARAELLDRWKELAKDTPKGSLIDTPKATTYMNRLYYEMRREGIDGAHGFRHAAAQDRYRELSGMEAPINGGPKWADMSQAQRADSMSAIVEVQTMLGHGDGRDDTTSIYLGRFE